jgi:hypothetical protein
MRLTLTFFRSTASRLKERGSAMLASLMVIVGLSLLGLAFVAMSETESAISINQRNHSQTVAVAEAGARLVVQWFQNPTRMLQLELMPPNTNAIKTNRIIPGYTGYYKSDGGTLLCDLPFGPFEKDKFYGTEDTPDVNINRTNAAAFLDELNERVFGVEGTVDARPGGEITDVLIFAPPLVGATLVTNTAGEFFEGGTRYGVATIMVRAQRFDKPLSSGTRRSIARAEVRIVISQFPVPTPAGPLQSDSALATNGNFNVNWGMVSSQQSLDLKKDYGALPWFNAFERIHINRGYDSSVQWSANTPYRVGDVVRPRTTTIAANPLLRFHEYTVTAAGTTDGTEPAWPAVVDAVITDGPTFQERSPTAYPLTVGGDIQSNTPWLYFIGRGNISIEDPWFHARSAMDIDGEPNNNPQPYPFQLGNLPNYGKTHHFQFQSFDQYPNFKELLFPVISYDFWKAAALAGNNDGGNNDGVVKYLRWVAADTYTDGITTKTMVSWATSEPGFYFFDTQNAQNPQNGGPGILAPTITLPGVSNYLSSFVYLNAGFATTGAGATGPLGSFNQPGEPYMDIGYREVAEVAAAGINVGDFVRDASGMPVIKRAVNGQWDYQDLSWSNTGAIGGGAKNDVFDVYIDDRVVHDPSVANLATTYTGWFPVPYRVGCKPGNNSCGTCNCSEPHEPYLNIKYGTLTNRLNLQPGWFPPSTTAVTTMRRPKITDTGERDGTPVTCTAASTLAQCTSNAYDLDGALVTLEPVSDGVLYVEGEFTSKGNAHYYGSVLAGGEVDSQGTPQLWYDESLSRGIRRNGFPRVMITSIETDR